MPYWPLPPRPRPPAAGLSFARAFVLGLPTAQLDSLDCTLQERGILVTTVVFLLDILLSHLVAVLIGYLLEIEVLVSNANPCGCNGKFST